MRSTATTAARRTGRYRCTSARVGTAAGARKTLFRPRPRGTVGRMRVGLLFPGEMGAAVGAAVRGEVLWASEGRSGATAARAAGFEDVGHGRGARLPQRRRAEHLPARPRRGRGARGGRTRLRRALRRCECDLAGACRADRGAVRPRGRRLDHREDRDPPLSLRRASRRRARARALRRAGRADAASRWSRRRLGAEDGVRRLEQDRGGARGSGLRGRARVRPRGRARRRGHRPRSDRTNRSARVALDGRDARDRRHARCARAGRRDRPRRRGRHSSAGRRHRDDAQVPVDELLDELRGRERHL